MIPQMKPTQIAGILIGVIIYSTYILVYRHGDMHLGSRIWELSHSPHAQPQKSSLNVSLPGGIAPLEACKKVLDKFGGDSGIQDGNRIIALDTNKLPPTSRFFWFSLSCTSLLSDDASRHVFSTKKREPSQTNPPKQQNTRTDEPKDAKPFPEPNTNQQLTEDERRYQQQQLVQQQQQQLIQQQQQQQQQQLIQQQEQQKQQQQQQPQQQPQQQQLEQQQNVSPSHNDPIVRQCLLWKDTYHVRIGFSWGTLPEELQTEWSKKNCDEIVQSSVVSHPDLQLQNLPDEEESHHKDANLHSQIIIDSVKTDNSETGPKTKIVADLEKKEDHDHKKRHEHKLSKKLGENADWCFEILEKYDIKPMKSWGRMPTNLIDEWKQRHCDLVFTNARMAKREISSCIHYNFSYTSTPKPSTSVASGSGFSSTSSSITSGILSLISPSSASDNGGAVTSYPNLNKNLPLIAIMAATTTRKVQNPSTDNMALFNFLLPSLIRTLDCGFRYEYVLGYDKGDAFYDSDAGMSSVKKWFHDNIEMPMRKNAISITLRTVKVHNTLKKPGPVFLAMAREAYNAGASYFYRVNDDTELIHHWPTAFTKALMHLPGNNGPFGVVGPMCTQGNQKILTHDFVHRLHMEIFEMNYYPAELTDWWMDDWISFVYGKQRTYRATRHHVIHHTGAHGQRYEVDQSHQYLLGNLVTKGRSMIRKWMLTHNLEEQHIRNFDQDDFTVNGFEHIDIPKHIDVI